MHLEYGRNCIVSFYIILHQANQRIETFTVEVVTAKQARQSAKK